MGTDLKQLSEREREILQLVATGLSNQQIANELGVSINTVKVHLRNVFAKLGAASRTEATMYAVRTGLVSVHSAPHVESPSAGLEQPLLAQLGEEPEAALDAPVLQNDPLVAESGPVGETSVPMPPPVHDSMVDAEAARRIPAARRQVIPYVFVLALLGAALVVSLGALVWLNRGYAPDQTQMAVGLDDRARWKVLPNMNAPRAAFAIAQIGELVYVVGGENETGVTNSVERYDSRFSTWTTLSAKPTPVSDVRAAVLGGKVYVPGGRRSGNPADITAVFERYDPRREVWERLPDLPEPRSGYALAVLEGKIYLFGGWDGTEYRRDVWEFSPASDGWLTRTPMLTPRGFADAAVVENNIYVLGGENSSGPSTSNEVYDPAQEGNTPWHRRAPLPHALTKFGTAVALGNVHVIGGEPSGGEPLKYLTRSDSWEILAQAPKPIGTQAGVVLVETTILTLGGRINPTTYSATVQTYQALFTGYLPRQ